MSRILRCGRCKNETEILSPPAEEDKDNPIARMATAMGGMSKLRGWGVLKLGKWGTPLKPPTQVHDLCEDCVGVFLEQFMKGARIEAITMPPGQNTLPHDNVPYQDCLLAFDPDKGGFICEHDDPERFLWLQRNRIQNVAEGVPEKKVDLVERIAQVTNDVAIAGQTHARVLRCSAACSEAHTYRAGCLLADLVSNTPGQIMPPACGVECGETNPDGSMTNPHHTYKLGTCLANRDTAHAVAVVCPVCKSDGPLSGIVGHMAEMHQMTPDYANHQWVGPDGRNLEGRLISQQGEDLTEAYSPQEPADQEEEVLFARKIPGYVAADDPTLMDSRGDS